MKKFFALLLVFMMCLAFVGCGAEKAETPAPAAPEATAAPVPATEAPAATPTPTEAPTPEPTPAADPVQEAVELALSLVDHPVEELYDALGEPLDSMYASSCLVTGGQDGILTYDGFTVYTLVSPDGTETVYDAE